MTIANELRAEVATALLVNRRGDPKELLNILKACDLVFRRLSSEGDWSLPETWRNNSDRLKPSHYERAKATC